MVGQIYSTQDRYLLLFIVTLASCFFVLFLFFLPQLVVKIKNYKSNKSLVCLCSAEAGEWNTVYVAQTIFSMGDNSTIFYSHLTIINRIRIAHVKLEYLNM